MQVMAHQPLMIMVLIDIKACTELNSQLKNDELYNRPTNQIHLS